MNDRSLPCALCKCDTPHRYDGSIILAPDCVDGAEGPNMIECHAMTCTACEGSTTVPHRVRADLDGESHGWVFDRRTPSVVETVRPPAYQESAS